MSLSTSEKLKVDLQGHTALVTVDNPGTNTWDTESLPALKELVEKLTPIKISMHWYLLAPEINSFPRVQT